jgi:hypothetical protein
MEEAETIEPQPRKKFIMRKVLDLPIILISVTPVSPDG